MNEGGVELLSTAARETKSAQAEAAIRVIRMIQSRIACDISAEKTAEVTVGMLMAMTMKAKNSFLRVIEGVLCSSNQVAMGNDTNWEKLGNFSEAMDA